MKERKMSCKKNVVPVAAPLAATVLASGAQVHVEYEKRSGITIDRASFVCGWRAAVLNLAVTACEMAGFTADKKRKFMLEVFAEIKRVAEKEGRA